MPGKHTAKQKRQARHIIDSERERGVDPKRAERIGWATVNKLGKGPSTLNSRRDDGPSSVAVPPQLSMPRASQQSYAPTTSAYPTGRTDTARPQGPQTVRETDKPPAADMPKAPSAPNQSVKPPAPPAVPQMIASRSTMGPRNSTGIGKAVPSTADDQFRALTEKLKRRVRRKMRVRKARSAGAHAIGDRDVDDATAPILTRRAKGTIGRRKMSGAVGDATHKETKMPEKMTSPKTFGKSLQVMSIDDYYDSVVKADAPAPGAPLPKPKKFPRKEKPTVKMKPISDQEAVSNIKAGKYIEKASVMLRAIKALVAGYGRRSGADALRAPNRGFSIFDLNRAMEAMPKPSGAKPPTTYLPGVHDPKSPLRQKKNKKPLLAAKGEDEAERLGQQYAGAMADAEKALADQLGESMVDEGWSLVVHKSEGDAPMGKTNFNDLFKSELGTANDEVLVDCPHCEHPITKSDLSKASLAKPAGPGATRGGNGHGQVKSSRGVPGAKKHDEPMGVQNSKGSKTRKSEGDNASSADDKSMSPGDQQPPMQKSVGPSIRGTDFVQYVNYGDAPGSDADIAKSIAQGQVGQQPTQPMDLNNDLSRLLV